MEYSEVIKVIADLLKRYDEESPIHKEFSPGIGPFGEPQIVKVISIKLASMGFHSVTKRTPDLVFNDEWAIEFKIVRPYGDNGKEAENWSVNLLHPYPGNVSLIGDAIKLQALIPNLRKGLCVLGFEHDPAKICLEPLICAFELIVKEVNHICLGERIEEVRKGLVHPEHQVLRCIGWEIIEQK